MWWHQGVGPLEGNQCHESGAPMMELVPQKRDPREFPHPLPAIWGYNEKSVIQRGNRGSPCCHSDLKLPASSTVRNKFLLSKSYSVYCTFYRTAWTKAGIIHGVSVATSDAIKTLCVSISQLCSQLHCYLLHSHASKMAIIKFKFQVQGKQHILPLNSCGKTFHAVALQIWWDISFS